ncbi:MAG: hypothetical protein EPO68_01330 [Planctomycetota bacterium]|nr:MAG: hypothetical protein EPO68_01330 [Planctomycetota bacterium]
MPRASASPVVARLGVAAVACAAAAVTWWFAHALGVRSALFAFELHFVLMAAASLVDKLLAPQLDARRFEVSPREVRIYHRLGVRQFMRLLQGIGWTRALRDRRVFDGTRATLSSYARETRHGENAHAWIFLIVLVPIGWAVARGWWDAVLWLGSMNVVFHVYPIMLQRAQRVRLERLLARAVASGSRVTMATTRRLDR